MVFVCVGGKCIKIYIFKISVVWLIFRWLMNIVLDCLWGVEFVFR